MRLVTRPATSSLHVFGLFLAAIISFYTFFILRRNLSVSDAGAVAASYGSVSAVTFVAAVSFLEMEKLAPGGHMVAVMALMESTAIIVGVVLMMQFDKVNKISLSTILRHSCTNGSVLMFFGSLIIGLIARLYIPMALG